jgi:hypothetical protein
LHPFPSVGIWTSLPRLRVEPGLRGVIPDAHRGLTAATPKVLTAAFLGSMSAAQSQPQNYNDPKMKPHNPAVYCNFIAMRARPRFGESPRTFSRGGILRFVSLTG